MNSPLPSLMQACDLLHRIGDPFPQASEYTIELNLTYECTHGNQQRVRIDPHTLRAIDTVYVNDYGLWTALHAQNIRTNSTVSLTSILYGLLEDHSLLIWGTAGYASAFLGVDYFSEGKAIATLYDTLETIGYRPGLVIDGGTRQGCLGLNAIIAKMKGIPTLGIIPVEGLADVGIHDGIAVCDPTLACEEAVGTIPDVLVCVGGMGVQENGEYGTTLRECLYAIAKGSIVLILGLRPYSPTSLPESYRQVPQLVEAEGKGQLFVCHSIYDMQRWLPDILRAAGSATPYSRRNRQPEFERLLNT